MHIRTLLTAAGLAAALSAAVQPADAATSPQPANPPPACAAGTDVAVGGTTLCGLTGQAGGTAVNSYLGIPYASAARWQAPAVAAVPANYKATQPMWFCPQGDTTSTPASYQSESCLYLNVWAPASAVGQGAKLPVMVFIHGGAFVVGSGFARVPALKAGTPWSDLPNMYDGASLAAAGPAIVVTLNYRLGALGFLATPPIAATGATPSADQADDTVATAALTGNYGLLDQQAALNWVHANIGAFGGDPAQVTIFGESAGAMSVGFHLFAVPGNKTGSAAAKDLFQAAIMESNPMGVIYRTPAAAQTEGQSFVSKLCDKSGGGKSCPTMDWLLNQVPVADILAVQADFLGLSSEGDADQGDVTAPGIALERLATGDADSVNDALPWAPVVDGDLVAGQPVAGFADASMVKPFAFGFNQDEGTVFGALALKKLEALLNPVTYNDYLLGKIFPGQAATIKAVSAYKAPGPRKAYFNYNGTAQTLATTINDFAFRCGNLAAMTNAGKTAGAVSYGYLFAQAPAVDLYGTPQQPLPACAPKNGQVCHANELPYVFNTIAAIYKAKTGNDMKDSDPNATLAKAMSQAWASFAVNPAQPDPAQWLNTSGGQLRQWNAASATPQPIAALGTNANCAMWSKVAGF
ncbi:carboxylesterase family protein [Azospirillum sp. A39]|uniref:carboxylesterase family protein n=1 Tax=Azospirillum sp. A39 TaxID=3462279 RepID=UPI0040467F8B